MDYLAARIEARPTDAFAIRGTAQTISLQNPHGDWFNYSGVPNVSTQGVFVDPTGKSGSHVGDEFDLEAAYKFKHLGSLTTGIALFDPGDFVKNVSGHGDPETFFYFQWQAKF
jgi:hypothetical protein